MTAQDRSGFDFDFIRACAAALFTRPAIDSDLTSAEQIRILGFVRDSRSLADPSVLSALAAEELAYSEAAAEIAATGDKRVPYLLTDAVVRVSFDPNVAAFVDELLDDEPGWVMWGANNHAPEYRTVPTSGMSTQRVAIGRR